MCWSQEYRMEVKGVRDYTITLLISVLKVRFQTQYHYEAPAKVCGKLI